jgi:signal transduction histidine kinase
VSPLSKTGAGVGLRGMRERIESLGGDVSAEPHEQGWTVRAAVPT